MTCQNSKVQATLQQIVGSVPYQPLWVQVAPETAAVVKGGPLFK